MIATLADWRAGRVIIHPTTIREIGCNSGTPDDADWLTLDELGLDTWDMAHPDFRRERLVVPSIPTETCPDCSGCKSMFLGKGWPAEEAACPTCDGSGWVQRLGLGEEQPLSCDFDPIRPARTVVSRVATKLRTLPVVDDEAGQTGDFILIDDCALWFMALRWNADRDEYDDLEEWAADLKVGDLIVEFDPVDVVEIVPVPCVLTAGQLTEIP